MPMAHMHLRPAWSFLLWHKGCLLQADAHVHRHRLTDDCTFPARQVIEGLDWVREHYEAPAVVVMALGGEAQFALDMAVRALVQSGVTVVVAAGNEDTDACSKSPARCARFTCRASASTLSASPAAERHPQLHAEVFRAGKGRMRG